MPFEYRTKPVRVEAVEWRPNMSLDQQPHFLWGALDQTHPRTHGKIIRVKDRLQVATANGTVMADPGDWIVFFGHTTGELHVYKDDEFNRMFEPDQRRSKVRGWQESEIDRARDRYRREND